MDCPECYALKKIKKADGETLGLWFWQDLIEVAANYGIKKVAIGGGEPTLRPDLMVGISKHAHIKGMEVSVTTNGTSGLGPEYFQWMDGISISWDMYKKSYIDIVQLLLMTKRNMTNWTKGTLKKRQEIGINYLIEGQSLMWALRDIMKFSEGGADFIYFLLRKPNDYTLGQIYDLVNALVLIKSMDRFKKPVFGFDTSIQLMRDKKPCAYGNDIVTVYWDGSVYPCSFSQQRIGKLHKPEDLASMIDLYYPMDQPWGKVCPFMKEHDNNEF